MNLPPRLCASAAFSVIPAFSVGWPVLTHALLSLLLLLGPAAGQAQAKSDFVLGAGDSIRIQVFQNPDLSMENRLSENGFITYPLIGAVQLGGLTLQGAEDKLTTALQSGGFLQKPQITITLLQVRNNQVSVLGQVVHPGRFPLESAGLRVSDMLAFAGGMLSSGDDVVILSGLRNGKPFRQSIDIPAMFLNGDRSTDLEVQGGDTLYVHRAPVFYIYGEAQKSGAYRIERGMTVMQAIAQGGGVTSRGSENRLRLNRRGSDGQMHQLNVNLSDPILPNDVIYIKESIF
ncbi:MAG: polysaccharide export protein EpsE [Rhodoferax sp.]|nr:polysaccharide export protein EpsE [Rhodoferax sp.]